MRNILIPILLLIYPSIYGQVKNISLSKGEYPNPVMLKTSGNTPRVVVRLLNYKYTSQYKALIEYAIANGIATPSDNQNKINDQMVRDFISLGLWNEFDLFYYFKQEAGTPYEFLTLNWVNPSAHRLTNKGSNNVSFVGGSGFSVSGGNSQYFNTNYNPYLNAVKFTNTDNGIIFKIFDIPSTWSKIATVFGGVSTTSNQVMLINSSNNNFYIKAYQSLSYNIGVSQAELNGHYHNSNIVNSQTFKDGYSFLTDTYRNQGTGDVNASLYLFANNYLGEDQPSAESLGLSYFILGSSIRDYNREVYSILNQSYEKLTKQGKFGFSIAQTAGFPSIYYPKVYKAAPFKAYFTGITKDYIVLYSTDHAGGLSTPTPANGAIGWGQCDDPLLNGYEDKGIIMAGYQDETPSLLINPNDPNGQNIWFFFHYDTGYPDNGGIQQTRLYTTSGGVDFSTATYADRGKVLGLTPTELTFSPPHTGYADAYMEDDDSITVIHITSGWGANSYSPDVTQPGIPKLGKSVSDGSSYTFTRENSNIDVHSFMPPNRLLHASPSLFFKGGGIQYVVARNVTFTVANIGINNFVSIYQCDGNYNPVSKVYDITGAGNTGSNSTNSGYYIEGDTLYIYFIKNKTDLYVTTWDLKNLD